MPWSVLVSDEPGYLQRMRQAKEQRDRQSRPLVTPSPDSVSLNAQEREAVRWAKETAKAELRSIRKLAGARYAVLLKITGAGGTPSHALEGVESKEALTERVKTAGNMSEEVVGAYEVKGGRPLTVSNVDGQVTVSAGAPRPGAHPMSPEQMLRKAKAEAEERAKSNPREKDDLMKGGRGRGGGGGGGGGGGRR
jgi:hypothetical protein